MTDLTLEQLENMSDEDFAKLSINDLPSEETESVTEQETTSEEVTTTDTETQDTPEPEAEAEPVSDAVPNEDGSVANTPQEGTEQNAGGEDKQETQEELTAEQAFYKRVTSEFNANGKAFKVDNADDVVSLMQKGLNYNQKMAAMKPGMKVLKALQERGIESVEDLGYLLDLQAKNPEAIARLIQESGVDAYELNEDKANSYQPSVPQVSDEVINFEMVAKSLDDNPHFGKIATDLGGYDDQSKQEIFKNPHLLNLLTDHVQNGYYDAIRAKVEQEQSLGRLNGMSFLQAYDTVGNLLYGQAKTETQQPQPVAQPVSVASKPKPSNNAARQAAAGTTSTAASVQKYSFTPEDIFNMSDEEFAKIDPKFL